MDQPEIPQPEQEAKPITDPKDFYARFRESDSYNTNYTKFFEGKTLAPQVTEDMKRKTFENMDAGRQAFYEFSGKTPFRLDPTMYSEETLDTIHKYIASVHKLNEAKMQKISQDSIINADNERAGYHATLAQAFTQDGITPSEKMGRVLAKAILVGEGLEKFDDTPTSQFDKIKSVVGGR